MTKKVPQVDPFSKANAAFVENKFQIMARKVNGNGAKKTGNSNEHRNGQETKVEIVGGFRDPKQLGKIWDVVHELRMSGSLPQEARLILERI